MSVIFRDIQVLLNFWTFGPTCYKLCLYPIVLQIIRRNVTIIFPMILSQYQFNTISRSKIIISLQASKEIHCHHFCQLVNTLCSLTRLSRSTGQLYCIIPSCFTAEVIFPLLFNLMGTDIQFDPTKVMFHDILFNIFNCVVRRFRNKVSKYLCSISSYV